MRAGRGHGRPPGPGPCLRGTRLDFVLFIITGLEMINISIFAELSRARAPFLIMSSQMYCGSCRANCRRIFFHSRPSAASKWRNNYAKLQTLYGLMSVQTRTFWARRIIQFLFLKRGYNQLLKYLEVVVKNIILICWSIQIWQHKLIINLY